MEFNNRTILITGLLIASFIAMYLSYKDIALAIVSGLVGYLSKDMVSVDPVDSPVDPQVSPVVSGQVSVDSPVDPVVSENVEDIQEYGSDSETA